LSAVELTLVLAAFGAGWTGTWSPCGFSMIETIGPTGHRGGLPTTLAACASFLPGALLGGVITFGQLALLGSLLHAGGGRIAFGAAALIAAAAALLELRGARIVPQVRRQLPEDWRRRMPLPLAAALYGVLLGLGFTTFVLTFGVWALAAISFALGEPHLGILLGLGFGLGRALPVVGLAPFAGRPLGFRAISLMAERPLLYSGFRFGDAALLTLVAVALGTASSAVAAKVEIKGGADPSVAPNAFAWQAPDGSGFLLRDGGYAALPGRQPAVGGPFVALVAGDQIKLLDRNSLAELGTVSAPGADGLAVSGRWLAYRVGRRSGDSLFARSIFDPAHPGPAKRIATTGGFAQISRPSLDRSTLVFSRNSSFSSGIVKRRLGSRHSRTILRSRFAGLFNPALGGGRIAYVRSSSGRDQLMIRQLRGHGAGHAIYSRRRRRGAIWTSALTRRRVFFTVLRGGSGRANLLSALLHHPRHGHHRIGPVRLTLPGG
jgi:hypothetical protein